LQKYKKGHVSLGKSKEKTTIIYLACVESALLHPIFKYGFSTVLKSVLYLSLEETGIFRV
jgi:hypothetical protein